MRFEKRRNQDRDRVKKHTGHTSVRLGRRGPSIFKKIRAIDTRERREFRGMTPSSDLAAEQWTQFTPVDDPRIFHDTNSTRNPEPVEQSIRPMLLERFRSESGRRPAGRSRRQSSGSLPCVCTLDIKHKRSIPRRHDRWLNHGYIAHHPPQSQGLELNPNGPHPREAGCRFAGSRPSFEPSDQP